MPLPIENGILVPGKRVIPEAMIARVDMLVNHRGVGWTSEIKALKGIFQKEGPNGFIDAVQEVFTETFFSHNRANLSAIEAGAKTTNIDDIQWTKLEQEISTICEVAEPKKIDNAIKLFQALGESFPTEGAMRNLSIYELSELCWSIRFVRTISEAVFAAEARRLDKRKIVPDDFRITANRPGKLKQLEFQSDLIYIQANQSYKAGHKQQKQDYAGMIVSTSPEERRESKIAFFQTEFDLLHLAAGTTIVAIADTEPAGVLDTTLKHIDSLKEDHAPDLHLATAMQAFYVFDPIDFDTANLPKEVQAQYQMIRRTQQWLLTVLQSETLVAQHKALITRLADTFGRENFFGYIAKLMAHPLQIFETKSTEQISSLAGNTWFARARQMQVWGATADMCKTVALFGIRQEMTNVQRSLSSIFDTEQSMDSLLLVLPEVSSIGEQYIIHAGQLVEEAANINTNIISHSQGSEEELRLSAYGMYNETLATANRLPILPGHLVRQVIRYGLSSFVGIQGLNIESVAINFVGEAVPTQGNKTTLGGWTGFVELGLVQGRVIPGIVTSDGLISVLAPHADIDPTIIPLYEQLIARSMRVLLRKDVELRLSEQARRLPVEDTEEKSTTQQKKGSPKGTEDNPYTLPWVTTTYVIPKWAQDDTLKETTEIPKRTHASPRRHFVSPGPMYVKGGEKVHTLAKTITSYTALVKDADEEDRSTYQTLLDQAIIDFEAAFAQMKEAHSEGLVIDHPLREGEQITVKTRRIGFERGVLPLEEGQQLFTQQFYRPSPETPALREFDKTLQSAMQAE